MSTDDVSPGHTCCVLCHGETHAQVLHHASPWHVGERLLLCDRPAEIIAIEEAREHPGFPGHLTHLFFWKWLA